MSDDQIDLTELRKNQEARAEAARINAGDKPGKYTCDMWNRIKGSLEMKRKRELAGGKPCG